MFATVLRLLTKRTYSVLIVLVALALPAFAFAAPEGEGGAAAPRIGVGPAHAIEIPALAGPVEHLHRSIRASVKRIRAAERERLRRQRARERREQREAFESLPGGVSTATLEAIAACESGGDPTIVSADGSYRGKYQFSFETWATVGGSGDPAAAPEAEQDYRAALLYSRSGPGPWPVCGQ